MTTSIQLVVMIVDRYQLSSYGAPWLPGQVLLFGGGGEEWDGL